MYRRTIRLPALELDDCFVAATAFMKHAVLVTGNHRHYPMADIKKSVAAS